MKGLKDRNRMLTYKNTHKTTHGIIHSHVHAFLVSVCVKSKLLTEIASGSLQQRFLGD